jgi:predicted HicB family RNase H-like nuclease
MARSRKERLKPGEGIVGVRMSNELIADLKTEARQRKISLGKLIQELWTNYRSSKELQRR